MEQRHKDILEASKRRLADLLNFEQAAKYLFERGVISKDKIDEIKVSLIVGHPSSLLAASDQHQEPGVNANENDNQISGQVHTCSSGLVSLSDCRYFSCEEKDDLSLAKGRPRSTRNKRIKQQKPRTLRYAGSQVAPVETHPKSATSGPSVSRSGVDFGDLLCCRNVI